MAVNADYRNTKLGSLPREWRVDELGAWDPFVTSGSRGWARYYKDTGSPFVRITNLSRESIYLDLSDLKFVGVPQNDREGLRTALETGDLLVSITADIGIIGYVDAHVAKPAYINQHIALVRCDSDATNTKYLAYFLASERSQHAIRGATDQGAKAGMNLGGVRRILAAFPPRAEQDAIAEALNDVDALLTGLDRLIAKKRDIKQAAMQQLLTGQTRLPGFQGDWEVKRLGDVAAFYKGRGLPKSALTQYGAEPCIHYGELFTHYPETIETICSRTDDSGGAFRSAANDVLMPTSDVTPRGLAKASCVQLDGVILGGDILVIRCDSKLVFGSFLSYSIRHQEEQILQLVTGTTVFHLYGRDMAKLTVLLPSVEEQIAIVRVLSDMAAELTALEARRDKTRALKQGMMQELLTGKTRLVKPEAAHV